METRATPAGDASPPTSHAYADNGQYFQCHKSTHAPQNSETEAVGPQALGLSLSLDTTSTGWAREWSVPLSHQEHLMPIAPLAANSPQLKALQERRDSACSIGTTLAMTATGTAGGLAAGSTAGFHVGTQIGVGVTAGSAGAGWGALLAGPILGTLGGGAIGSAVGGYVGYQLAQQNCDSAQFLVDVYTP